MSFPRSLTDASHFHPIPWCAALLSDPQWTTIPTGSRSPKASTEDSFFAETLQTDRTVRGCLVQHTAAEPSSNPPIQEVRLLLDLGSGVNGYPHTAHGGFVATLLDEVVGVLLTVNTRFLKEQDKNPDTATGINSFTASLNVRYHKPVPTPGVVLGRAGVLRAEGRKKWLWAAVEDGRGEVLASAEALFIEARPRL